MNSEERVLAVLEEAIKSLDKNGDREELVVLAMLNTIKGASLAGKTMALYPIVAKFNDDLLLFLNEVRHEYTGMNWLFGASEK